MVDGQNEMFCFEANGYKLERVKENLTSDAGRSGEEVDADDKGKGDILDPTLANPKNKASKAQKGLEVKAELILMRQKALFFLNNNLLAAARHSLEYILSSQKFKNWANFADQYNYAKVLERQGDYYGVIAALSAQCNPRGEHYTLPVTAIEYMCYTMMVGAFLSLKDVDSARKLAEVLSSAPEGYPSQDAQSLSGNPSGYTPLYQKELFEEIGRQLLADCKQRVGNVDQFGKTTLISSSYVDPKALVEFISEELRPALESFEAGDHHACFEAIKGYFRHDCFPSPCSFEQQSPVSPIWLAEIKAVCYSELFQPAELLGLANQVGKRQSSSAQASYFMGLYHQLNNEQDEARRCYLKAIAVDEHYSPAWIALAHYYSALGDHDQAVATYARIIRFIDGRNVPSLVAIASEYLRVGKHVIAGPYIDAALKVDDSDPHALNELGVLYYIRSELDLAEGAFKKAEGYSRTDTPLRSAIIRNRTLTRLKAACRSRNAHSILSALKDAQTFPFAHTLPFILELSSLLAPSEEQKSFILSACIASLTKDPESAKNKTLLRRLIEKNTLSL